MSITKSASDTWNGSNINDEKLVYCINGSPATTSENYLIAFENKTLRNKEEIEQEFKNLRFIHQHEEKNNDETIFNETTLNGSFKDTFILRETDDSFILFPHSTQIISSLSQFWEFYDAHKSTHNILIDSRMVDYIAYATIKYGDDVLIYDSYSGKIMTIYYFCSNHFHIQTNELTITQIKQLFIMYLLVIVYARDLSIQWNINNLIRCIKTNDNLIYNIHDPNANFFNMIINYIGTQQNTTANSRNILKIINYFIKSFSKNAYYPECENIEKWNLEGITRYEFIMAITVLKNNDFYIYYI